ncbi:MAG TPA: hypothetical protein VGF45_22750, partial [Polyangia bacterium]
MGAVAPGPEAEARLAATLAAQSGRTVEAITQALTKGTLRVAHGVSREVAETIARQLQGLGASTNITTARGSGPKRRPDSSVTPPPLPTHGFAPLGTPASSTQRGLNPSAHGTPAGRPPPPPSTNPGGFTLTPLSGMSAVRTGSSAPAPSLSLAPLGVGVGGGAFEAPPSGNFASDRPSVRPATPARQVAPSAFSGPSGGAAEVTLELARELPAPKPVGPPTSISSLGQPAYTVAGASGLNTSKIVATSSTSGLALSDEEQAHTERCRTHGLLFDRRKSKGCRRCVQNRKSASLNDEGSGIGLRGNPTKRAFLGFGFALLVGFLPAAYYAKNPGAAEVERLRAEQTELSKKPGTEAVLRRFDQIDDLVSASQSRAIRNTLFIWVDAGG